MNQPMKEERKEGRKKGRQKERKEERKKWRLLLNLSQNRKQVQPKSVVPYSPIRQKSARCRARTYDPQLRRLMLFRLS